jgi:hypothetical protein
MEERNNPASALGTTYMWYRGYSARTIEFASILSMSITHWLQVDKVNFWATNMSLEGVTAKVNVEFALENHHWGCKVFFAYHIFHLNPTNAKTAVTHGIERGVRAPSRVYSEFASESSSFNFFTFRESHKFQMLAKAMPFCSLLLATPNSTMVKAPAGGDNGECAVMPSRRYAVVHVVVVGVVLRPAAWRDMRINMDIFVSNLLQIETGNLTIFNSVLSQTIAKCVP